MNEALQNPFAQTLISYSSDSDHSDTPKQLIKLDHLALLHSYGHFTAPSEVNGTVRAHSSVTPTWPKAALGITAEQ